MTDHTPLRRCTQCGESKPATTEYFPKHARKKGHLETRCKACVALYKREYAERNKDALKAKRRARYEANKDAVLAQQAEYRRENADLIRQRKKEEYERHKDKYITRAAKWQRQNREFANERARARWAANREAINARLRARYVERGEEARAVDRRWKAANRERVNQANRDWHARNREAIAAKARAKREANPQWAKERANRWYAKHKESELPRRKANRLANPTLYRRIGVASGQRRRARKADLPSTFTTTEWESAIEYFGGCCAVCGRQPGLFHKLSMDHWIPVSSSDCPGHIATNIVPLCHGFEGCNNSKSNRDALEWLIDKFGTRKAKEIVAKIVAYFDAISIRGG